MRSLIFVSLVLTLFASCGEAEPRRPVEVKTGSFFKESIERNKELLEQEEKAIQRIIDNDTLHEYVHSSSGSWYYYETKNDEAVYTPRPDDLVTMTYELMSFDNDTIYSGEEIGIVKYKVDKQELFPGLRNSVKLLKEGETAVFLFPSSLAYGYHGDNNKIGINVPLKARLTLLEIERNEDVTE
ncbi:gliding motility-associated peptidyl-prolyl isomerase GldI [Pseudozobellia thermophila]|uniref:Peptidyl-prolyl cis-trans isomerase n=1 Tax=Pseudozobellia thermophila TaxID=192903 RepID=A0A1M6J198_9FLAO|nr:gliding motility-associated peptidyl-prolyl isomerase GldI [Pseudozobellia thermophila]SHJ40446.1 protein involved in gliding motility GldI [Pseudozobellia thermophila]